MSNLEVKKIKGNTYYVDLDGTCTGIYRLPGNRVVLIDSGRTPSEELFSWFCEEQLSVAAVIHTHLHIDHIANSRRIAETFGAELYACRGEGQHRSVSDEMFFDCSYCEPDSDIVICKTRFSTIFTEGHSPGHQMVVTPDGVCFAGDGLFTEDFLSGCICPYMEHTWKAIESMRLAARTCSDMAAVVAAHHGLIPEGELDRVVELNIKKEMELYDVLLKVARDPMDKDMLADRFMVAAGVKNKAVREFWFMIETSMGRIEDLLEQGLLVKEGNKIRRSR